MNRRAAPLPGLEPEVVNEWSLKYEQFDPDREGLREALCALGNGYFATRGAAPESVADGVHYPGTYVAGLYNRRVTEISGRTVENETIVNLPNWLPLTFRPEDGPWFHLTDVETLEYAQELDLYQAVLRRKMRVRDHRGRVTRVEQRRFVSMADEHLAGLETLFVAENWSGKLIVRSALDGRVVNGGVARYSEFNDDHLVDMKGCVVNDETISLVVRTNQSGIRIAQTARTHASCGETPVDTPRQLVQERGYIAQDLSLNLEKDESTTIEKIVALFTSKDRSISEPAIAARTHLQRAGGFRELLNDHNREWDHLWKRFSLEISDGGNLTQLILHLHIFHLLQTVSRNSIDLDVGVPARGLHGEAYRGHIFWDDLFIYPYLTYHLPELVRSLLLYRYRRLPEARWAAREAGCRGALFPWQSGSDGREESQVLHLNPLSGRWMLDASHLQRHINSAIAYNIWNYYQATHDIEFLASFGAEVILEIARYWSSAATFNPALGRYEILGVTGPDEYHDGYPGASTPGLNNNAYTNVMAVWVLCRGLEVLELLSEPRRNELCESLSLDDEEVAHWDEVSRNIRLVFSDDGILSQFEGYEALAELDWAGYRDRYGDISRLDRILESEGDTPNAYKASKQADVLMLLYLLSSEELRAIFERLGYPFDPEKIRETIGYYLQRTSHGSTLSRVVHAWVLARSDRERSWALFEEALRSDLDDVQGGTTAEGIHLGAMAGTVDILQRCYLGIEARADALWLNPLLPSEVRSLNLDLRYDRRWMNISVKDGEVVVEAEHWEDGTIRIGIGDEISELRPGESRRILL